MTELGVNTKKVDAEFVAGVIGDNDKEFFGPNKFMRALRLLEGYLRDKEIINKYKIDLQNKQPVEYQLFKSMLKIISKINDPSSMKSAINRLIKMLNSFIKGVTGEELYLNYFTSLEPFLKNNELGKRADKVFHVMKFVQFNDLFLVLKEEDHCCMFISGLNKTVESVNQTLRENKAEDALIALNF